MIRCVVSKSGKIMLPAGEGERRDGGQGLTGNTSPGKERSSGLKSLSIDPPEIIFYRISSVTV